MARKFQDLTSLGDVRTILSEIADELNTTRRDWTIGYVGTRCYHNLKSWNYTQNGLTTEEPGTGSAWAEVVGGTANNSGIISPINNATFTGSSVNFQWSWDSTKTPSSYTLQINHGGSTIFIESGQPATDTSRVVSNLPTDGGQFEVFLILFYTDGPTGTFTNTYTAATSTSTAGSWIAPVANSNVSSSSHTAQWNFGTKIPLSWTLTVTNVATSSVLQTYNGSVATTQLVTGLPNDGSSITETLNVNYTDGFSHAIGTTFINGTAVSNTANIEFTVTGSTYTGEVVVSGASPRWKSSVGEVVGSIQTAVPAGTTGVEVFGEGGTIIAVNMPNTGLSTLMLAAGTSPTEFDLEKNSMLSIPAGTVDFSSATKINLLDVGSGVFIRDQDISPAGMTYFNICNCQDHTITGMIIGQMSQIQYLCLQGINLSLTDAHMSAANYNQCTELRVGYNSSMAIGEGTLGKMPNLQLFHCPSSTVNVTANMFAGKNALTQIDVAGRIASQTIMNAVLNQIRGMADANNLDNGNLIILSGNPAPTGGASNPDVLALQARSWSVS